MKNIFKPILFSTPMVQAIQNGTKNQTRRTNGLELINDFSEAYKYEGYAVRPPHNTSASYSKKFHCFSRKTVEGRMNNVVICPYTVDDILWVRETFHLIHDAETDAFLRYGYKADNDYKGAKWKPSIFMPREACRIFLKINAIRAERLLDISREDAIKEGVILKKIGPIDEYKDYMINEKEFSFSNLNHTFPDVPTLSFFSLWESINGSESLNLNPWVWVVEFEKVERTNDF